MTRLRGHDAKTDWDSLHTEAKHLRRKVRYRTARCEHGYSTIQNCHDCEGGYMQDTSVYANLPTSVSAVAVSDDMTEVAFYR
jgi:hypothetical protein